MSETALESMPAREVFDQLGTLELFRSLPPEELHALVDEVEPVSFAAGTVLMREGDAPEALYLILDGELRVTRGSETVARLGRGGVAGEMALLGDGARTASVVAETPASVLRVTKSGFDRVVSTSPHLRKALEDLAQGRRPESVPSPEAWAATALRAIEARSKQLTVWQGLMGVGLALWAAVTLNAHFEWVPEHGREIAVAVLNLVTGLLVLQGACEAFIVGVERLGARLGWDGFLSGTVGSLVSTLPEFVVIVFLVKVNPLAAFVTAVVTIYNNALVFGVYSFFLPKDRKGVFAMPRSLTIAGGELLIAGSAVSLIVGLMMLMLRTEGLREKMHGSELLVIGGVLSVIYAFYMLSLVRYYAEGKDDEESVPPDPSRLGHDTEWSGIIVMFALGAVGAYCGGEAIGAFAETALTRLNMPTIPTAAALAFFAGVSEYVIVYKSHRRGELGIALSNVFGGMTQVMFMLLPFTLILIGALGMTAGGGRFFLPMNIVTQLLWLLLFPLFYSLHQYLELDRSLSNLDAVALTGVYVLLLFFLLTAPV